MSRSLDLEDVVEAESQPLVPRHVLPSLGHLVEHVGRGHLCQGAVAARDGAGLVDHDGEPGLADSAALLAVGEEDLEKIPGGKMLCV